MQPVVLSSELIRERARARGEPAWLVDARLQAFATYEKLEAPRYKRTDLRNVDIAGLALSAFLADTATPVRPKARDDGVVQMPLALAAREHEALLRPLLGAGLDAAATKWDALQAALWTQGTFVHVPAKVEASEPLAPAARIPATGAVVKDVIVVDRLGKATLIDRWTGGSERTDALALHALDVHLRDGASLQLSLVQELARSTRFLTTRRAHVGRDARLAWIDGQLGASTVVAVNESVLAEQGAKVEFLGAFYGGKGQHFDITTSALHRARSTESQLNMRGALNADGYAANYSIVFISEDAPASSGHQHQETLILGDNARADAIPKLDVETNEVSASHGATVGQVDPDQVFYLRSRGLDEAGAKRLIVEGFFEPLLREIPLEGVREELARSITSRLK